MLFWLALLGVPALCIGVVAINVRKSRRRLVAWWMAVAFAVALSVCISLATLAEVRQMKTEATCALRPLDFDNDSVRTLQVEWWPPRVQCEYGYSASGDSEVVWESRWFIYLPFLLVPGAIAATVGAIRHTRLRRSSVTSQSSLSTASA